ncbi:stress response translation initiation inhibitor YciH [Halogeometricum limi]|uniref:Translation initiation factor 1 n=1 Tax=Halogeometricum limi TaxID=555875 RepID=A0A1I6HEK1_9EURY|nr:stress response translation initiation inhibitor YciH [Halogeometricum limi]SFR52760.1 translation initiation factor 1 [Halogeometricum limi]
MAKKDDLSSIAGLPDELGIDQDLAKSQQRLSIHVDTRRYGKAVTVVSGFDRTGSELRDVASQLKRKLACGGTVEDDAVELQGDHTNRVGDVLREMGYEIRT